MHDIFAHSLGADGVKEILHGNSERKQVIKFANYTRNRGRVCLFFQNETTYDFSHVKCIVRVSTSFAALLLAVRTSTSRSLRR